jgi:AAA domain
LYRRDLTYFPANLIDSTRASNLNDKQQTGPITLGTAIVGPIGIGKSLAVDNTLKLYPQVVQHTSYRGDFHSVDRKLGTSYARLYVGSKTAIEMMPHIATVGVFHGLGCLIIDEIQHLKSAPSGGIEVMLNFFVEMENTMQIPIILIGTPKAVDVLTSEFRSAHLAHPSGRVYITQLTKQFTKRHEDGNLEKLGCPLSAQQNSSWLADMLRGRPRCFRLS